MNQKDEKDLQPWQPMEMSYVGDVREVVQAGGGQSGAADDPGDQLKPPGQG